MGGTDAAPAPDCELADEDADRLDEEADVCGARDVGACVVGAAVGVVAAVLGAEDDADGRVELEALVLVGAVVGTAVELRVADDVGFGVVEMLDGADELLLLEQAVSGREPTDDVPAVT